jgi:uncharacterized radical SAM protein YgiQ
MRARRWEQADVVLVSGDAYVDHPSFAAAILGRVLESKGFRVAVLPQPDWRSADAWRALGPPRLFYAVSAGNMDSMINHMTANRKRRNDDAYSPGGRIGLRPDRPTPVYAQRCREAFPGVPVVVGGVEASLRRLAHYDYWSDTVRPSILASSKADLLVYGMGERPIVEIASRLDQGEQARDLRDMRGVCYLLGKKEPVPSDALELPSFDDVKQDKSKFARATRLHHHETNPLNARRLTQRHGDRVLVHNPPTLPLTQAELDAAYDLPYVRRPHPRYQEPVPAYTMIKDSVTIMRGCFGGCTFCSITMHEGRTIQSRSERSILAEVERLARDEEFKGTISDLGGPTANMYRMRCTKPEVEKICRRLSCIHPKICPLLGTSHKPTLELLRKARRINGVKRVFVASGIRMDLANLDDEYIDEVARHHTGGHLKIAPEHTSDRVLDLMKKPSKEACDTFAEKFVEASGRAGKEQYLVPYFIASHPGSTVDSMIDLAVPQAARVQAAPGAGLHSRADGRRDDDVLHGPGSADDAARRDGAPAARPQGPACAHAVLPAGELLRRAQGAPRPRPQGPHRRRPSRADPRQAAERSDRRAPPGGDVRPRQGRRRPPHDRLSPRPQGPPRTPQAVALPCTLVAPWLTTAAPRRYGRRTRRCRGARGRRSRGACR